MNQIDFRTGLRWLGSQVEDVTLVLRELCLLGYESQTLKVMLVGGMLRGIKAVLCASSAVAH